MTKQAKSPLSLRPNTALSFKILSLLATILLYSSLFCAASLEGADKKSKYPQKTIALLCTGSPGGTTDREMRVTVPYLSKYLGTSINIEYLPGLDSLLAFNKFYKQKPDGYSLLAFNLLSPVVLESTRTSAAFVTKEFSFLAGRTVNNFVLAVHPENWKTFGDFLNSAKQKKISLAATGGTTDLQGYLLEDALGIKFNWVPYSSGQEAVAAVAGKHVDAVLSLPVTIMPMAKAGRLRPLVIFSSINDPVLPGVPSLKDLGYGHVPTLQVRGALAAPPHTPPEIVKVLEKAMKNVAEDPAYLKAAQNAGVTIDYQPAAALHKLAADYYAIVNKYKALLK